MEVDPAEEERKFQELKAELQKAFATPDSSYITITLEEFLKRMKANRSPPASNNQRPHE